MLVKLTTGAYGLPEEQREQVLNNGDEEPQRVEEQSRP
jgi:hypothetical protein